MGTISSRMVWEDERDRLLQYLRLSVLPADEEDPLLSEVRMMLTAAIELAEQYVGDGLDYLDIEPEENLPEAVRLWCYRYVAWRFNRRDDRKAEATARGGDSVTWGEEPDYSLLSPWRTVGL